MNGCGIRTKIFRAVSRNPLTDFIREYPRIMRKPYSFFHLPLLPQNCSAEYGGFSCQSSTLWLYGSIFVGLGSLKCTPASAATPRTALPSAGPCGTSVPVPHSAARSPGHFGYPSTVRLLFPDSLSGRAPTPFGRLAFFFTSATKLHFSLGVFFHFITGADGFTAVFPPVTRGAEGGQNPPLFFLQKVVYYSR